MTVDGYMDLPRSPHVLSKKVIDINPKKEADNTYRTSIRFNMNEVNVGKYTFVIEWLFPDHEGINSSTVTFQSIGGITIHKTSGRLFDNNDEDHSRYLVRVERPTRNL